MKNSDNLPDAPGDQMFSSMEAKHPDHWLKSNYFSSGCLTLGNPFNFRLPPLCPVFHSVIQSFSLFVFLPLLLCVRVALPILTTTMKLWDGRQGGAEWGAPLWEWALSRVVVLAGFLVSCIFMLWDILLWVSTRYLLFSKRTRPTFRWKYWISLKKEPLVFVWIGLTSCWTWRKNLTLQTQAMD